MRYLTQKCYSGFMNEVRYRRQLAIHFSEKETSILRLRERTSALCPMPYAPCPMPYALCPIFVICYLLFVIC
ncbi:MAG: hypothetical protein WBL95_19995 [Microcoleus sp.]